MKNLYILIVFLFSTSEICAQVVMTDKGVPNLDNSAILKLDANQKGVLLPRTQLISNTDVVTIPSPQNGNITFNANGTVSLPQTVTFFEGGKWNALFNKDQAQANLDIVTISSLSSAGNIRITGYNPGAITLGTGTTGWTSLGITDSKTFSRANNSVAFTVEGMNQIDKTTNEYYEYAIGVFVDDQLAVVRKYHRNNESGFACSWNKFILNGVINNLSTGTHSIKVMARNISSTSNSATQSIIYGGAAQNSSSTTCNNMSAFMSKIVLSTTVVESL